jgi:hypothetical protein
MGSFIVGLMSLWVLKHYVTNLWADNNPSDAGWVAFWFMVALGNFLIAAASIIRYGV